VFEVFLRLAFLRISSAVLVQMKGCLRSFQPSMKARILALSSHQPTQFLTVTLTQNQSRGRTIRHTPSSQPSNCKSTNYTPY
jgi:hypothetical protein